MVYLPDTGATTGKQVLLSNCMNLDLGAPSMELSLQDNRLVLNLVTDAILSNTTQNMPIVHGVAAVPYTVSFAFRDELHVVVQLLQW